MSSNALRARQGSVADRVATASDPATPPELLTWLAADPAPEVRLAVAANRATPPQAGLLLAEDSVTEVREALARRVGKHAPATVRPKPDRPARINGAILGKLVADARVEVRAALSEAIADLPDAPRDLILRLAGDAEQAVAAPVLRLSPLLGEPELLALLESPPSPFARRVIASRARLSEPVADAIAGSTDSPAIAELLRNPSAAIREATLDRLAAASQEQLAWQDALARRGVLPPRAARALGAIIAAHLLDVLASRPDLPPGLAESLRPRVEARLAAVAKTQHAAEEAAGAGDRAALVGILAKATHYSETRLEAALAMRSARAVVALCWRAGWTPALAESVQGAVGIAGAALIRPNAEGEWTMSLSELQWQIELLEELPG